MIYSMSYLRCFIYFLLVKHPKSCYFDQIHPHSSATESSYGRQRRRTEIHRDVHVRGQFGRHHSEGKCLSFGNIWNKIFFSQFTANCNSNMFLKSNYNSLSLYIGNLKKSYMPLHIHIHICTTLSCKYSFLTLNNRPYRSCYPYSTIVKDYADHGKIILTGDGSNRWFDKCATMAFMKEGWSGFNTEHSGIDAMVSGMSYIYLYIW